jgi:hypothetical protein
MAGPSLGWNLDKGRDLVVGARAATPAARMASTSAASAGVAASAAARHARLAAAHASLAAAERGRVVRSAPATAISLRPAVSAIFAAFRGVRRIGMLVSVAPAMGGGAMR